MSIFYHQTKLQKSKSVFMLIFFQRLPHKNNIKIISFILLTEDYYYIFKGKLAAMKI